MSADIKDTEEVPESEEVPVPTVQEQARSMLVENTGRHMLDSGGAYGRNFERNAGKTVEDFEAEPSLVVDRWNGITVSLYRWIVETLTVSEEVHRLWTYMLTTLDNLEEGEVLEGCTGADGTDLDSDYYWHDLVSGFPTFLRSVGFEVETGHGANSYNGECFLSQTVQYERFTFEGEATVNGEDFEFWTTPVLMLQVHGGCDVRGGYTCPYPFVLYDTDDYAFEDFARVQGYWQPPEPVDTGQEPLPLDLEPVPVPEPVYFDSYDAGYSFSLEDGEFPGIDYHYSNRITFDVVDFEADMSAEEVAEEVESREAKRLADKYNADRPTIYLQRCKSEDGTLSPDTFEVIGTGGTVTFVAPSLEGW